MLIADEIVSALDISIQAQTLDSLLDMQTRLELAMLFVSHDLRVVRHLAHHLAVMYLGQVVEHGTADAVFQQPRHLYTQAPLRAVPGCPCGSLSLDGWTMQIDLTGRTALVTGAAQAIGRVIAAGLVIPSTIWPGRGGRREASTNRSDATSWAAGRRKQSCQKR